MNIFDAILEAVNKSYRHYALPNNIKEVNQIKSLITQLQDRIKQLENEAIESEIFADTLDAKLYSTAQSVTCKRILNMEVEND